MAAKNLVFCDVIDHDGFVALPDFVTDRGLDLQFSAGLEAERDFVANRATNPSSFRNPCDGGKAHSGGTAYNLKNTRNGVDTLNGSDIGREISVHNNYS